MILCVQEHIEALSHAEKITLLAWLVRHIAHERVIHNCAELGRVDPLIPIVPLAPL